MDELLQLVANAHVIDELTAEGVNVALPLGACGIDLIAFVESVGKDRARTFVPIHIVVLRDDTTPINREPARSSDVLTALVWDRGTRAPIQSFALTSAELTVVKMIDLIDGADVKRADDETGSAGARDSVLRHAIARYAMSPGKWRKKLAAMIAYTSETRTSEPCGSPRRSSTKIHTRPSQYRHTPP